MKHIITALIAIACIVAGGVGGHFLRSASAKPAGEAHAAEKSDKGHGGEKEDSHAKAEKADAHGKGDSHGKDAKAKDAKGKGGHGKESAGSSQTIYYKFSREFVVPVIRNNHVNSLVILHLSIEADASISQKLFEMDPKLRDNIMTTLINISNDGRTFETLTDVESYESMRSLILMNLKTVVPTGVHNILIMDMARQDV